METSRKLNLEEYVVEQGLRFMCEDHALNPVNGCLDMIVSSCYFVLTTQPVQSSSFIVYIGQGCTRVHAIINFCNH